MNWFSPKYLLLIFFVLVPGLAFAQMDDDYFVAEQLFHQQKFEQAYEIFNRLHRQNPTSYLFLDKATECLINLKKYEEATALVKQAISQGHFELQGAIRLGEIYHVSGDSAQAFSVWDKVLKKHEGDSQIALRVARVMKNRDAYSRAIEIYQKAAEALPSSTSITSELTEVYLQSGKYQKAIREFLRLVKQKPREINFVQTRLIRLHDDALYATAVDEIAVFLDDLPTDHPAYQNLRQLEIWLLMEQKSFEQALQKAEILETNTSNITYTLYNLGSKLLAEKQFELAQKAFSFYVKNDIAGINHRSSEKLAEVFIEWAGYYEEHNLGLSPQRQKLYNKAFTVLQDLRLQAPHYQRMDRVLITLAELSLDVLHLPQKAEEYLEELQNLAGKKRSAQVNYIGGRIYLYEKNYNRARIAFTESSKQKNSQELSAKSHYYLALTEFYSGDYDFAEIQLKALERENVSYFANNALQLRLWIQDGLQADSTGKSLDPLAKAIAFFEQGKHQQGVNELKYFFGNEQFHPLADDALVELTKHKNTENILFIYKALHTYLLNYGASSPLYERLLWEKARIADQLVMNKDLPVDLFSSLDKSTVKQPDRIEKVITLYEEILLKFPAGFYAAYARDRIQKLQKINT